MPTPAPLAALDASRCPKCHRVNATTADFRSGDVADLCPATYAYRDPDAAADCERVQKINQRCPLAPLRDQLAALRAKWRSRLREATEIDAARRCTTGGCDSNDREVEACADIIANLDALEALVGEGGK